MKIILYNSQLLSLLTQTFDEVYKPCQLGCRSTVFPFYTFHIEVLIIQSPSKF